MQKEMHTREAEALLLPVRVLIDLRAQNLLHQVLRIGAMHAPRRGIRAIRHAFTFEPMELRASPKTLAMAMAHSPLLLSSLSFSSLSQNQAQSNIQFSPRFQRAQGPAGPSRSFGKERLNSRSRNSGLSFIEFRIYVWRNLRAFGSNMWFVMYRRLCGLVSRTENLGMCTSLLLWRTLRFWSSVLLCLAFCVSGMEKISSRRWREEIWVWVFVFCCCRDDFIVSFWGSQFMYAYGGCYEVSSLRDVASTQRESMVQSSSEGILSGNVWR